MNELNEIMKIVKCDCNDAKLQGMWKCSTWANGDRSATTNGTSAKPQLSVVNWDGTMLPDQRTTPCTDQLEVSYTFIYKDFSTIFFKYYDFQTKCWFFK